MSLVHLQGREKNLAQFGWTAGKAEWIALVCLHSGSFLRSQMCRYLQIDRHAACKLVGSIVARGFAVEVRLSGNHGAPHLCRISNRQIYRALGAEHIRYRRVVKARVTFLRVLGLDYILEHPTPHWLPTEHDKVDFFHSKLNVPTHLLPSRVYKGTAGNQQRFFVSKYPIAHDNNTVTFLYIDPHDLTDKPLRLWLSDHHSLFDALRHAGKRIRVVAVASQRKILARADRILSPWSKAQPVPHEAGADTDELAKIKQALVARDTQTLQQQWGGPEAAFKRMSELAKQSSPEEEVPKEAATTTATSRIDSHSLWHSTRLTGIDFESLNWGQFDPPVTEKSCNKDAPDSEGGLLHI